MGFVANRSRTLFDPKALTLDSADFNLLFQRKINLGFLHNLCV